MKMLKQLLSFIIFMTTYSAYARSREPLSFGLIAKNMLEPIEIVSGFVSAACLLVGVACLFAAIVKYFEHRKNPLYVPISTVVWLVILGLLLVLLPFVYMLTSSGIPFTVIIGGA